MNAIYLRVAVLVLLTAAFNDGSDRSLPDAIAAGGATCRLLVLPHVSWPTLLGWWAEGITARPPSIDARGKTVDPCAYRPGRSRAR